MNPVRQKVVSKTPRAPINRQSALVIAPSNWLSKPLPPEPERNIVELEAEITQLKRDAQARKDSESKLNRLVGKLTERVNKLNSECDHLSGENLTLRKELHRLLTSP